MVQQDILNFKELLNGESNQLRYVTRFSTSRTNHKENIAEHSFFTAFFSMCIGQYVVSCGTPVDMGLLVQKALLHDIEEQFTGDIIRPVKYSTEDIKDLIQELSVTMVSQYLNSIFPERICGTYLYKLWKSAKENTIEGRIIKFADYCSVLSYLFQEVRGGNFLVMKNVHGLEDYYNTFMGPEFDFIRSLIEESGRIVSYLMMIKQGENL